MGPRGRMSFRTGMAGSLVSVMNQMGGQLWGGNGAESNEDQLPFYKKIKYVNKDESDYSNFKAICFQEGLLQEVAMMLAPNRPPSVVYNGFKLASFFVSKTEIPILLKELDSLTIFQGLKERAESKFKAKHDSPVGQQLDLALETIQFQINIMRCFFKGSLQMQLELDTQFSETMHKAEAERLEESQDDASKQA